MKIIIAIVVIVIIVFAPAVLSEVIDFDSLGKKIDKKSAELEKKTTEVKRKREGKL